MSSCKIDHSLEDVQSKLRSQKQFLAPDIFSKIEAVLTTTKLSQPELNEIFHLLKKYDLVSDNDKQERNRKLLQYAK